MMKNKRYWIVGIAIVILIMLIIACLRCCDSSPPIDSQTDSGTEETTSGTLDFIPADDNKGRIQIPAITGLNMKAGQLKQTVDFYNPQENRCFFVISLYLSDNTLIYQSDRLAPGEYITDITLLQELQRGLYRNCRMVYNCTALDGKTPLNGSSVVLEINSQ